MFLKKMTLLAILFPALLTAQNTIPIIPKPVSAVRQEGVFTFQPATVIKYDMNSKELAAAADFFKKHISSISAFQPAINKPSLSVINLKLGKFEEIGNEGYNLDVAEKSITISANTKAGIVYGMQSLFQLLPAIRTNAALQVPCMKVKDYPRFGYRGMMLDVSRHFFGPDFVKEYIDLIASYKMNRFHWHLVDDPGWRIEIKKYPELTKTGAWRVDRTNKNWGDRPQASPGEAATYGGYYTQEQIKDIVKYAAERNVTIIPEIEMPGHVASAIATFPYLSCNQVPQLPMTGGNYSNMSSNYCPGNDSVFTFIENVLSEVIQLFPSTYIHVGGDEVDKSSWKKCARCQHRMKTEGLKTEEELQSYFVKRVEKFILSKKRRIIGWDEILEGGIAPEATIMSWRGEAGGIEAAKMDHNVVMTPGYPLYFDHYQAGPEGEPQAFGGMNTLKNVYDYEPIPKELNASQAKFVMGAQANLWTEMITTAEGIEYMILPRMLALAEVVWSEKGSRDWNDFNARLKTQFRGFEQRGIRYCKGNFKVNIVPVSQNGQLNVSLNTESINGEIHYTTDGTYPNAFSPVYTTPFAVTKNTTVKAVTVIDRQLMSSPVEQTYVMHQAVGRDVVYTNPFSKYYPANGPNSLTDGVRGTTSHGKYWHGFSGQDLIATIDLGKETSINKLSIGCLQNYKSWIFLPQQVKFEISNDGKTFTEVAVVPNNVSSSEGGEIIKDFITSLNGQKARYVRVTAKIIDACPKGHPGEGHPGWLFADEIVVE